MRLFVVALALTSLAGCTLRQQVAHETAYDYSDYDYYDHPFATSPSYRAPSPGVASDLAAGVAGPSAGPPAVQGR